MLGECIVDPVRWSKFFARRAVGLCCIQELRWSGASGVMFSGKDSMYKFFWVGEPYGTERVGILLKEMLDEHSVDVN